MIKIENFDNATVSGITYGGHSGSKKGIILNGERWFLKYPKSTKSMNVIGLSYTTSPISEYLGSHIYNLLGFDVHETLLGIANGKIVVACKDFLKNNETILDYNSLKNDYDENIEKEIEELSSSSKENTGTDIEEIIIIMNNNSYFAKMPELKMRFWDMFVVDALISNNDRNDNNWGLILDHNTMNLRIPPVYDNGAAFYSKSADEKINSILNDSFKMKQVIYDSSVSSFLKDGKRINPLKFIEKMDNEDLNNAILRITPKINLNKIKELFASIPSSYDDLPVLTDSQRKLYYESIVYKYEHILKPIYNKLNQNK